MVLFSLAACQKENDNNNDDNNPQSQTQFLRVGGEQVRLQTEGLLFFSDGDAGAASMDVVLLGEGIQVFYDNDGFPDSIYANQETYALVLNALSTDTAQLSSGNYPLDEQATSAFHLLYGEVILAEGTEEDDDLEEIVSGSLTVSREGANYVLTGSFEDARGRKVEVNFKGNLSYFNIN